MQYFVAVAEELHFGRAAERLHIAQPSLSHEIRRLEQRLGVTLLDRTSRHVELTEAGRALLSAGRRLLAHSERATRLVRSVSAERLTVGFYGSAGSGLLPDLLRSFGEDRPSAEVSVRELLLDQLDELLSGRRRRRLHEAPPRTGRGRAGGDRARAQGRRAVGVASFSQADHAAVQRPSGGALHHKSRGRSLGAAEAVAGRTSSPRPARTHRRRGCERAGDPHPGCRRKGVCVVPAAVAHHYPRADVVYVEVSDADPAVLSLAWPRGALHPIVGAFIEVTRQLAPASAQTR